MQHNFSRMFFEENRDLLKIGSVSIDVMHSENVTVENYSEIILGSETYIETMFTSQNEWFTVAENICSLE